MTSDKPWALFILAPLSDDIDNFGLCALASWHATSQDAIATLPTDVTCFKLAQVANFISGDLLTLATDGVDENNTSAVWTEDYGSEEDTDDEES
jgi:hypothetical protein